MKVRYVLLYRRISGGYISPREKEKEEENEKEKERETERECRIVAAYGSVTELKAWVLAGVRTRTCAALSAPRVFVCEIAPYTLSRWKVRYIVNPVLSTLSRRRSLYQVPPGCICSTILLFLSLFPIIAVSSSLFRSNYPVSPFFFLPHLRQYRSSLLQLHSLSFSLSRARARATSLSRLLFSLFLFVALTAIQSRYTCLVQPPFFHSASTLHYRFILRFVSLPTRPCIL